MVAMSGFAGVLAPSTEARLRRLRRLAWLLDAAFRVPGTRFRFGVDGLVGLAPMAGDVVMGLTSLYIVWEAHGLGVPRGKLARMLANVAVETSIGAVPIVGDVFDMAFKANLRNIAIVEDHLGRSVRA